MAAPVPARPSSAGRVVTRARELLDYVTARYDEEEQIARSVDDRSDPWPGEWVADGELPAGFARHVATWDPARVLRELAMKREWLADAAQTVDYYDKQAALSDDELHDRRNHPAWEYATTEGPRKAWYHADEPPEGEGWERNATASDPDAWERFDYTEESYWRRRRPEGPEPEPVPVTLRRLAQPYATRKDYPAWLRDSAPADSDDDTPVPC